MAPVLHRLFDASARLWSCLLCLCSLLVLFALPGCLGDVAHDNPFDPQSDSYMPAGDVTGIVTDRASRTIADATILLEGRGSTTTFRTTTDVSGMYQFHAVPSGEYWILTEKDGFAELQDSVSVLNFETVNKNLSLNGAPRFEEVMIRSAHISRVWPPPTDFTLLEVMAHITDVDGVIDIEKAWFEIAGIGVSDTLLFTEAPGFFRKDLAAVDLGLSNMEEMLGEEIVVKVRDRPGYVSVHKPLMVARIIAETPVVSSPQAGAVLSVTQPLLRWVCRVLPYSFTYRVDVVRIDNVVRNSVTEIADLDPGAVCMDNEGSSQQEGSIQVDIPLDIGAYFWTVTIVDDFGNSSRSKEAGFVIN